MPFCREKKEFATSCQHRFPVSLRPRRSRQSNLGVESERRRTCKGLHPKAGPPRRPFDPPRSGRSAARANTQGNDFTKRDSYTQGRRIFLTTLYIRHIAWHIHTRGATCRTHTDRGSDKTRSMRPSFHECTTTVAFGFSLTPAVSRGRTRFGTVQQRGFVVVRSRSFVFRQNSVSLSLPVFFLLSLPLGFFPKYASSRATESTRE